MVDMNAQSKVKHQKEKLGMENLTKQQPSEWFEVLGQGLIDITLFLFFNWSIMFLVRSEACQECEKMLQIVTIGNTCRK